MALTYKKQYSKFEARDLSNVTLTANVGEYLAVNSTGGLCASASTFLGILPNSGSTGDDVAVVSRDNSVIPATIEAPNNVAVGDALTVGAGGHLKKAVATNLIVAYAIEAHNVTAGNTAVIPVQLRKGVA